MADTKISALAAVSPLAAGDKVPVADASDLSASKSATMTELELFLGMRKLTLSSDYQNATSTGTLVTGLNFTGLVAGTYYVKWMLLYLPDAITSSVKYGVNYTGTKTLMSMVHHFPSAGVTAATGTWEDEFTATTGAVWAHTITRTETTTAPNLGPYIATTATTEHYNDVEGIITVSDSGDLELWCASEVTANIRLKAGSSAILIRF